MFQLDGKIEESIIFAMENQDSQSVIDLDTGELKPRMEDGARACEEDTRGEYRYESIPEWTSQDGFRLMEQFAQTLGHPIVRTDLLAALSRGRGVFRAFKNALEAHPDTEKKWYEYKTRAMKARIVGWYEDLRAARGLERLGLEPEDTDDLLLSDFRILRLDAERWKELEGLSRACREDALSRFPEALVEYEFAKMERDMAGGSAEEFSVFAAECEPGGYAGAAFVRTQTAADRTFDRLVFLYVDADRRRIGLGRRLVEHAREASIRAGIRHFFVDIPFLWQEFASSLEGLGYSPFGTRWMTVSD